MFVCVCICIGVLFCFLIEGELACIFKGGIGEED